MGGEQQGHQVEEVGGHLEEGEVVLLEGVGGIDAPEEEGMVCAELPQ